jgi:hypothetical protein
LQVSYEITSPGTISGAHSKSCRALPGVVDTDEDGIVVDIYAVAVNVVLAGQLAIYIPFVNERVVVAGTSVFGQVGAVTPGVNGIPGRGSYKQANAVRFAENMTLGATPAAGGPFESSKVIGVRRSVAVFVH